MQNMTLVYYGSDSEAARALAARQKDTGSKALLREAGAFDGEVEACDRVIVTDDVPRWQRDKLAAAYPGKVAATFPRVQDMHFYAPEAFMPIPTEVVSEPATNIRRRGRPPGSKNKAA